MMLTTHIKNFLFLWRENRKEKVDTNLNVDILFWTVKQNYTKKNSWVRNKTAELIKKIRKEKPYRVINYSKAKHIFETQQQAIEFDKVKKGDYIVKFTENFAIKGERWCEYYTCFVSGTGTFKVGDWHNKLDAFRLYDYKRNDYEYFDSDDVLMFRFATEQEIEEFKSRQKNYKEKKKEIKKLQDKIQKLYKEL